MCSANCTIDRGSWRNTVIGRGCKLDNLVGGVTARWGMRGVRTIC